ncbi:MAG: BTAD domain-containing putative transcriptional regulator [bacterium]
MSKNIMEIYTLGNFHVQKGNVIISEKNKRSNKMWNLFQYLLSKPNTYTPIEVLIEEINLPMELIDAKNALENLVYRLRKLLAYDEKYIPDKYIKYNRGCYSFNWEGDYFLDFREFTSCYQKGNQYYNQKNYEKALQNFLRSFDLYKGDYLAQNANFPWLLQERNKYRELFLEQSLLTCNILFQQKNYKKIIEICRKVLLIEPFSENFHALLIEALSKQGQFQNAASHYKYTLSLFSGNEVSLSSDFMNILERLQKNGPELTRQKNILTELNNFKNNDNLYFLSPEAFKSFVYIEKRKQERNNQSLFLVSININLNDNNLEPDKFDKINKNIELIFLKTIRKSDVITHWEKYQYLILFRKLSENKVQEIIKRIKDCFYQIKVYKETDLDISYKNL